MNLQKWHLVADIGGTNARFGRAHQRTGELSDIHYYSVAEYPAFIDALSHYLADIKNADVWHESPDRTCLAVACAVDQAELKFTNSPWQISRRELAQLLASDAIDIINDFAGVAYAIPHLNDNDWVQVGGHQPQAEAPIAILGAGTGLGMSTLVPVNNGYAVVEGEGGHVDFSPVEAREIEVLKVLKQHYSRVSVERVLSGKGIVNLYSALAEINGQPPRHNNAAAIVQAAVDGAEPLAVSALAMFCEILGSVAGNLALINGAKGGVFIAGGIVPRFLPFFEASGFRNRFQKKGRFEDYLHPIPVKVVVKENLGLLGAAIKTGLAEQY